MQVKATAKYIKISPEKISLIVDQIKKYPPKDALSVLGFVNKSSSPALQKIIKSAIANAKNNFGLTEESLKFKEIFVGKGPMSKRYRPVSRGRAHPILKRTSHITVILEGEQKVEPKQESGLDTGNVSKKSTEDKNAK